MWLSLWPIDWISVDTLVVENTTSCLVFDCLLSIKYKMMRTVSLENPLSWNACMIDFSYKPLVPIRVTLAHSTLNWGIDQFWSFRCPSPPASLVSFVFPRNNLLQSPPSLHGWVFWLMAVIVNPSKRHITSSVIQTRLTNLDENFCSLEVILWCMSNKKEIFTLDIITEASRPLDQLLACLGMRAIPLHCC